MWLMSFAHQTVAPCSKTPVLDHPRTLPPFGNAGRPVSEWSLTKRTGKLSLPRQRDLSGRGGWILWLGAHLQRSLKGEDGRPKP